MNYNEMKFECIFSLIVDFDESIVLQKLQQLKTDKSPGLDVLLSCCAEELCLPLSLIYHKSYDTVESCQRTENLLQCVKYT